MDKNQDSDPRSGMTIPNHIRELKKQFFGLKILKFFHADSLPGSGIFLTLDPRFGREKLGSGINIPDTQHSTVSLPQITRGLVGGNKKLTTFKQGNMNGGGEGVIGAVCLSKP